MSRINLRKYRVVTPEFNEILIATSPSEAVRTVCSKYKKALNFPMSCCQEYAETYIGDGIVVKVELIGKRESINWYIITERK